MRDLWKALRTWAPAVHAEATTAADVARRLRAERRRVGLKPQGYEQARQYVVLLTLERDFREMGR